MYMHIYRKMSVSEQRIFLSWVVVERLEGKQRCIRAAVSEHAGIQARKWSRWLFTKKREVNEKTTKPSTAHTQSRQRGAQTTSRSSALVRGRSAQFIANPCRWPQRPCPKRGYNSAIFPPFLSVTVNLKTNLPCDYRNVCCFVHFYTCHPYIDHHTHSGSHFCSFYIHTYALSLSVWKCVALNHIWSTWYNETFKSFSRKVYSFVPRIAKKCVRSVHLKKHAVTCASTSKETILWLIVYLCIEYLSTA